MKTVEKKIKNILGEFIDLKQHQAFIFGSRATRRARKFSDYDIGIIGGKPLNFRKIALIKTRIEESDLPCRVDIVDFSTVSKNFKDIALTEIKKL